MKTQFNKETGKALVVVFAAFVNMFLVVGLLKYLGIIQQEIAFYFGTSTAYASMPGVASFIAYGVLCTLGIMMAEGYTIRRTIFFGGFVGALGIGLSSFLINMPWVIVFFGVGHGISFSCTFGNILILIARHFKSWKALATGIVMTGSSCSQLIMPIFFEFLLEKYALSGALLILSGLYLHTIPCAMLFKLIEGDSRPVTKEGEELPAKRLADADVKNQDISICLDKQEENASEKLPVHDKDHEPSIIQDTNGESVPGTLHKFGQSTQNMDESLTKSETRLQMASKWKRILDFSVFRNYLSLYFMLFTFVQFFGYFNMIVYTPGVLEENGIRGYDMAYIMSIGGIGDVIGRLATGAVGDLKFIQRYRLSASSSVIASINVIFLCLRKSPALFSLQTFIFGMLGGCYNCLIALLCFDFMGPRDASKTLAFALPMEAVAGALGMVILGYLKDVTGSYTTTCVVCGVFYLSGAIMVFFLPVIARLEDRHRERIMSKELAEDTKQLS